jgi:3',5'-nucleoside bisphosphate phosphatase
VTAPAAAGPFVDLHSHSTASDGHLPPAAVVEAARVANLAAFALTDHDTVAGVPEAQAAGARVGMRVVAGCELSAHLGESEIHLLALHIDNVDVMPAASCPRTSVSRRSTCSRCTSTTST